MRCRMCREPAGWFRRRCQLCSSLLQVYEQNRGTPLQVLLPLFAAAGGTPEQVQAFLAADPDGGGAIGDRIAADMANQLFAAFGGTDGVHTAEDVRRLRARGAWTSYGEPPE